MAKTFFKRIPKNIFMAWDGEAPQWATNAFNAYRQMNPDYNCVFFNSLEIKDPDFPLYPYQNLFEEKFYKADLFRYYLLNKYGGIWVDCDTMPLLPFNNSMLRNDSFVIKCRPRGVYMGDDYIVDNYLMGSEKNSKLIKEICKRFKYLLDKTNKNQINCYAAAIFILFKNKEIENYATTLPTYYSEEASDSEREAFFNPPVGSNSFSSFLATSVIKHFRNNAVDPNNPVPYPLLKNGLAFSESEDEEELASMRG